MHTIQEMLVVDTRVWDRLGRALELMFHDLNEPSLTELHFCVDVHHCRVQPVKVSADLSVFVMQICQENCILSYMYGGEAAAAPHHITTSRTKLNTGQCC